MAGSHGHGHAHDHPAEPAPRRVRVLLTAVMAPLLLATLAGLVALWPGPVGDDLAERLGVPSALIDATVRDVAPGACAGTADVDGITCNVVTVRLEDGPDAGLDATFELPEGTSSPALDEGDRIVVSRTPDAPPDLAYAFADYQRDRPLGLLALLFAAAVVALGRVAGLRALAGVAVSLIVLTQFLLPSILDGNNPLAVAIVGASTVMFVALYLVHGFTVRTTAAVLGTLASLTLTGVLAVVFVGATRLTGLASEEATLLKVFAEQVDVRGLVLAGIVIGTLGVLDDVTVTQVSAVWELRRADPSMGFRDLYAAAVRIGRDHIASTVNTLVLAYAGASLPLLIFFVQADRPLGDVVTGETVAIEVVRTLVGSIGLVASVPITTALAALVVTRDADEPPTPAPRARPRPRRETREKGFRVPRAEQEFRGDG